MVFYEAEDHIFNDIYSTALLFEITSREMTELGLAFQNGPQDVRLQIYDVWNQIFLGNLRHDFIQQDPTLL